MAEVVLSKRLQALVDMVTPGMRVADVGCDHGFVSISLVQRGISPGVLAMDVRPGPLSRAQEHVAEYGYAEYIETRLSDGLQEYREGEADSLICAGMGGRLMMKILTESRAKAQGLQELILQPQSELAAFRRFLRDEGYHLLDENILYEEGKYYFVMKVHYVGQTAQEAVCNGGCDSGQAGVVQNGITQELADKFGPLLLQRRAPVLKQFLMESLENMRRIEKQLSANDNERARERLVEVQQEIHDLEMALSLM